VKVTWEQRLGRVGAKEIESRLSYFSRLVYELPCIPTFVYFLEE